MENPSEGLAPIKNAAMDNINRNFIGVNQNVASQMSRRGMGSSGANGAAQYQVGLARGGAMADLEGQFADRAIGQKNLGANLGANLLNFGKGSTGTFTPPDHDLSQGLNNISAILAQVSAAKYAKE